ncbi:MAG: MerR family transcriptional regulator [Bryobacteraceae bacterium]
MSDNLLGEAPTGIPEKMFFRIGEVSRLVGVPPYVLRFWETEFPALAPKKSGRGHRLYRRKDVELFLQIKHLLYEKRFTIEGARQSLRSRSGRPPSRAAAKAAQKDLFGGASPSLEKVREELMAILKILA